MSISLMNGSDGRCMIDYDSVAAMCSAEGKESVMAAKRSVGACLRDWAEARTSQLLNGNAKAVLKVKLADECMALCQYGALGPENVAAFVRLDALLKSSDLLSEIEKAQVAAVLKKQLDGLFAQSDVQVEQAIAAKAVKPTDRIKG